MFGLGVSEVLIILVAALIFIGPKKLPALARTLGKAFSEFQNATKGISQTLRDPIDQSVKDLKEEIKKAPDSETSQSEKESE